MNGGALSLCFAFQSPASNTEPPGYVELMLTYSKWRPEAVRIVISPHGGKGVPDGEFYKFQQSGIPFPPKGLIILVTRRPELAGTKVGSGG